MFSENILLQTGYFESAQNSFLVWFIFCMAIGLLIGGIWQQETQARRVGNALPNFWPKSFRPLFYGAILGGVVGIYMGHSDFFKQAYKISCEDDGLLIYNASRMHPTKVRNPEVMAVRPYLITVRGAFPWSINIYLRNGDTIETGRISDRNIKGALERINNCLSQSALAP